MDVLLVDLDSTIPNIALMKLSQHHKSLGDSVKLKKCAVSYYPGRTKKVKVDVDPYDKVYVSSIFPGSKDSLTIDGDSEVLYGGTGYDLCTTLPKEVESEVNDYSLYNETEMSYGFLTRGCIRHCDFCFVPKKEGKLHRVKEVDEIVRHKKVMFLDNNIFAYEKHLEVLQELVDKKIHYCFQQGYDIRLLTEENSSLLQQSKLIGDLIFAFDNIAYKRTIERQLPLLDWVSHWRTKFYVYVHPDMAIEDTLERVHFLKNREKLPYIMRDISCWESYNNPFYVDIAAWCNQPSLFIKMTFPEFLEKRHKNRERIGFSKKIYEDAYANIPSRR